MALCRGLARLWFLRRRLGVGVVAKLVTNLVLVPIPSIGANGAAIGSVVCHLVAFTIVFNILRKNIKLDLKFSKFVVKPVIATAIMSICSYFVFMVLNGIIAEKLATIIAIAVAIVIYVLALVALRIFTKEEIFMIPYGKKIFGLLEKMRNILKILVFLEKKGGIYQILANKIK